MKYKLPEDIKKLIYKRQKLKEELKKVESDLKDWKSKTCEFFEEQTIETNNWFPVGEDYKFRYKPASKYEKFIGIKALKENNFDLYEHIKENWPELLVIANRKANLAIYKAKQPVDDVNIHFL